MGILTWISEFEFRRKNPVSNGGIFFIFADMKRNHLIWFLLAVAMFAACSPYPRESERMAVALEQAEAVYGEGDLLFETDTVLFIPGLAEAADYYAGKKQYRKAALAALYNGYTESDYDKVAAMESFKKAERYSEMAHDSLTMARAEYQMGLLLYYKFMNEHALDHLKNATEGFKKQYDELALTSNLKACCYLCLTKYDSAEFCLNQGLFYAGTGGCNKVKTKVLNNYAVLYRMKGENVIALEYLKKVEPENPEQQLLNYLNLGNVFMDINEWDSAQSYYRRAEALLSTSKTKESTKASIYHSLSQFEEKTGNYLSALHYERLSGNYQFEIMKAVGEKNEYRIQQQFNYESAMNHVHQKMVQRQRIIMLLSLLISLILTALGIALLRLLRIRKSELDLKASLINYTKTNQALVEQIDSNKATIEDNEKNLSKAMAVEQLIMQKLAIYLDNPGDTSLLHTLKYSVWGSEGFWHKAIKMFDAQHPGLRRNLLLQYPNMSDQELKTLILSSMNASREDSAILLHISVHMVDKLRNTVKKKVSSLIA